MREKCPGPLEISKTLASKPKGATIDRFQINGTLPCGIGINLVREAQSPTAAEHIAIQDANIAAKTQCRLRAG